MSELSSRRTIWRFSTRPEQLVMMLDAVVSEDTPLVQQFEIVREDGFVVSILPYKAVIKKG